MGVEDYSLTLERLETAASSPFATPGFVKRFGKMICPKCGFQQPDELYCAFCGVNVKKYARRKRKRQRRIYLIVLLVGVAGISAARYMSSSREDSQRTRVSHYSDVERKPGVEPDISPGSLSDQGPADIRDRSFGSGGGVEDQPAKVAVKRSGRPTETVGPSAPGQNQAMEARQTAEEPLTAEDWFDKGRAMDDESEAEVECYQNAIALDQTFAPAYFRLGAIYYRQANYEMADAEFLKFLEYATEAEQDSYNIYVYYSPSQLERLTALKTPVHAEGEESGAETGTPVEGEEGTSGTRPEPEMEDAGIEGGSGESSEKVMTIVRFLPYDGHIMVPVVLNGVLEAHVLVDTGSGITVLSKEMAGRLGLEGESGRGITLRTMAANIEAETAMLHSIQIGDLVQNNLPVAITTLPPRERGRFDGILGMDFMGRYKIRIDNANRKILFGSEK